MCRVLERYRTQYRVRQIRPDTISWLDSEATAGADPADAESLADLRDVIFCATNCRQERSPTSTLPDPARLSDRAPPARDAWGRSGVIARFYGF
jgi:hypothetical protein